MDYYINHLGIISSTRFQILQIDRILLLWHWVVDFWTGYSDPIFLLVLCFLGWF